MKKILIFLIRLYQVFISPLLGGNCRFAPTCSHYAIQAINKHGVIVGIKLAAIRISKCHPFNPGGYDPVPDLEKKHDK
ncbi:MAG: membrane protein insertion efficiency factor YidD [Clostridiales bacterium GWB2_37_7]|nr:MAG: membrane protein insertion efficiency factor YidD [Clostridiales bacterium GWB2_37_7]